MKVGLLGFREASECTDDHRTSTPQNFQPFCLDPIFPILPADPSSPARPRFPPPDLGLLLVYSTCLRSRWSKGPVFGKRSIRRLRKPCIRSALPLVCSGQCRGLWLGDYRLAMVESTILANSWHADAFPAKIRAGLIKTEHYYSNSVSLPL